MSKLQQYVLVVLRLAFLAASLPIPLVLHGQTPVTDSALKAPVAEEQRTATAKQPGKLRIGVALPGSDLSTAGAPSSAAALQEAEVRLLTSPSIEAVALQASKPEAMSEEARVKDCDLVLTSSLSQTAPAQSRFSKLGGFKTLQMAATAAQFIPVVSVPAMIATMAGSQLASLPLARLTSQVKAGSDISLHYMLHDRHDHVLVSGEEKSHSNADADDVLTPLVVTAAAKVLQAAR